MQVCFISNTHANSFLAPSRCVKNYNAGNYEKALPQCEKACSNDDYTNCYFLAEMYINEYGVDEDITKAIEFYKTSCDLEYSIACNKLGNFYLEGEYLDEDYKLAFKYFSISCDLEDPEGCNNVGFMYYEGLEVDQDTEESLKYFNFACDLNNAEGCFFIAKIKDLPPNRTYERRYHRRSRTRVDWLGLISDKVFGYPVNKNAEPYYQKSCDLGFNKACTRLKEWK